MTAQEIRDIAVDSAASYYKYLDENEKGVQIVDVHDIEYLPSKDLVLKLRLSAKLFDTESVFFKLLTTGKKYDVSEVKIVEYDNDKNILLVKIKPELSIDFSGLRKADMKVISDLKFLVQRVKAWYELNGAKIAIPTKTSPLKDVLTQIKYIPGSEPSENQKQSLSSIFTNPFTYVWGAPGTGKTKYVLAYAVLHYISNNKKVAILAPTNNALEQVLRGVVNMTDRAGIERRKIIRLGTPSRKFAEEFPEVCEEKGVQKNLDEIDKQINIIERIIAYETSQKAINEVKLHLLSFDKIDPLHKNLTSSKSVLDASKSAAKKTEIDIKYLSEEIQSLNDKRSAQTKNIASISHKLKKAFSSAPSNDESNLEDLAWLITDKSKQKELYQFHLEEAQKEQQGKEDAYNKIKAALEEFINTVKTGFNAIAALNEIASTLNSDNWEDIKSQLNTVIEDQTAKLEIDTHLQGEYSLQQLQESLESHKELRSKLAISSTEERLISANIIACTLDGYIGRFVDTKLRVDHIFLDEACYANIIKALTLFNQDLPITFLGDHMQLPPVCEINDMSIQKDEAFKNMFLWAQSAIYLETLFDNTRDTALLQYLDNKRFQPKHIARTSLNSTYRFGANLAKILGSHVYNADFNSCNDEGETKIVFIHAKKIEELKSRISIKEVDAIKILAEYLKANDRHDYVILTPYVKQVKLLGSHMPQERNDYKILTVHGSQGREWETVILSVVDTSDKWFVDSTISLSKGLNLVNTAVSRAKRQLVIVCDTNFWANQKGQLITDLIKVGDELTF